MKALYFAWVRERVGAAQEELAPPAEVATVSDLIAWLAKRDESHAHAFENPRVIRVALDKAHVAHSAPIAGAAEVAFFPPMTGG
jgi:molybdopterin synthase sulfur carrier subunit